jgi:hypothetical protein
MISLMSELDDLRPTEFRRVIDVVRDAGIDVSDWANFAGGPSKAAVNPKYCYEWAFAYPDHIVVLNVWYRNMLEQNGSSRSPTTCVQVQRSMRRLGENFFGKNARRDLTKP